MGRICLNGLQLNVKITGAALGRPPIRNVVLHLPGPKGDARNVKSELEAWSLIFDDTMINKIFLHTNQEIAIRSTRYKSKDTTFIHKTFVEELKALIGLLYLSGALKTNHLNSKEL